ncbi:unnamed protein product [Phytomonas sp. Hart1]|nr:unnamed protein product [Phytomonas sp. Hart1]|eukprot:CCW68022.1 unnamed protein product [Phytomonas sp. isolate Hart1]
MPPNLKRKLPRQKEAQPGELNLESAADEKIDAVTSEPLIPNKYLEVVSPDGSLRLFYNVDTLIRIAVDKGGFMQPPHFREPMEKQLREKIEAMEGKKFQFEARGVLVPSVEFDEEFGSAVIHRHVYFEQIVDEFYSLSPAEVYVCPDCFEYYVNTHYIPFMSSEGKRIEYIDNGMTPVIDPLDVLMHMQTNDTPGDERDHDTALILVVFRTAALWKAHMSRHHSVKSVSARDYRLRDVLCSFYNHFNQLQNEKYHARHITLGETAKRPALNQQRYWQINSRYNRLRYNRIVDAVELAAATHAARIVERTVFPAGEKLGETLMNPMESQADDSNFINDDDESEDDGFAPHYTSNSEISSGSSERNAPKGRRGRGKRQRSDSSSSDGSSSDETESESEKSDDSGVRDHTRIQHEQSAHRLKGVLAKPDPFYERLSAEGRRFLETAARKPVAPSSLYDPILHRVSTPGRGQIAQPVSSMHDAENDEEIDWENIGGTLTPGVRPSQAQEQQPSAVVEPAWAKDSGHKLLLSDAEDDVDVTLDGVAPAATATSSTPNQFTPVTQLLMDEDY